MCFDSLENLHLMTNSTRILFIDTFCAASVLCLLNSGSSELLATYRVMQHECPKTMPSGCFLQYIVFVVLIMLLTVGCFVV
jgi:hypothetical protein